MKNISLILAIVLLLPFFSAMNVTVSEIEDQAFIMGADTPIILNLELTNNGKDDTFRFYNLLGFHMESEEVEIDTGKSVNTTLILNPKEKMKIKGKYNFNYYIKGSDDSEQKKSFLIDMAEIKDSFKVGSEEVIDNDQIKVSIENTKNFNFKDIKVKFSSDFFEFEEEFSIDAYDKKTFDVKIDEKEKKKLLAGFYTIKADISAYEETGKVEGTLKFVEKGDFNMTTEKYGFIINTKVIEKVNQGNTLAKSETVIKKNVFTRLFTSVSPEPDATERDGTKIIYYWTNEIKPDESITITVKTNWLFPVVVLFLIAATVYFTRKFLKTEIIIRKKVSHVKTKNGEFALKVTISVKSQKYLERLNIIERIPSLVRVYHQFTGVEPIKVDEERRRIDWRFEKMEAGEVKRFSYIIYSKVGMIGTLSLPKAKAVYEKAGIIKQVFSNNCFFTSKQKLA